MIQKYCTIFFRKVTNLTRLLSLRSLHNHYSQTSTRASLVQDPRNDSFASRRDITLGTR